MKNEPVDIEDAIEDLSAEAVICRDLSHSWRPHTAEELKQGRRRVGFERALRCTVCGTLRTETLDAFGGILSRNYTYPDGYTVKGLGRITGGSKDFLRMTSLIRLVDKTKLDKK